MRGRRYWRNLGLTLLAAMVVGTLVIAVFVVALTIYLAPRTLEPKRVATVRSPAEVGITDWKDVAFTASDSVTLRGWYVPPQNGAVVIMAHGYGGNRDDLLPEAGLLAAEGYGALLFDFRAHGSSDNVQSTVGDHERSDLRAALDFVAEQPGVAPDCTGAIGFSMGGATLALVAAEDERLSAVVVEAAFATLEDVIDDSAGLLGPLTRLPARWAIQHDGVDVDAVRPVDALCNISPRPLLLIYGDQDGVIPPGTASRMFEAACPPAETWLIPGAGHENLTNVLPEEYPARLLAFFQQNLCL